jgi:hypothetical protein
MIKNTVGFISIVAAIFTVWAVTPANAQYYHDYSGYENNGAEEAANAANDAANAAAEANARSTQEAQQYACRANAMMYNRNPANCY